MCGDLGTDSDSATLATYRALAAQLLRRGAVHRLAQNMAESSEGRKRGRQPPGADLPAYMANMFQDIVALVCADAEAADMADSALLIAQSVVLARTAGVLAAQLQLGEDPLRQVIEALMDGYAHGNGGRIQVDHHHHHPEVGEHHHDHDHGRNHG